MMNAKSPRRWQLSVLIVAGLAVGAAVAAPHWRGGDHAEQMFAKLDTNADGQITRDEAEAFAAEQRAGIDANNDGFVSFEEAKAHRQAKREQRARERFARLDSDGDGKVSLAEMEAPHEMKFERMDRNSDGVISQDEIPSHRGHHGRHGER